MSSFSKQLAKRTRKFVYYDAIRTMRRERRKAHREALAARSKKEQP